MYYTDEWQTVRLFINIFFNDSFEFDINTVESVVKKNAVLNFKILRERLKPSIVKVILLTNRKAPFKNEFVPIFVL